MNKPTVDLRLVVTCFSVAAMTALSVWHAYHFYFERITHPNAETKTVRMQLVPLNFENPGNTKSILK